MLNQPCWKNAVLEEIQDLEKNNTWDITDLSKGKNAVGCKWIFMVKYKEDGSIDQYKAHLVARGFDQSYSINYQETFAPNSQTEHHQNSVIACSQQRLAPLLVRRKERLSK